MIGRSTDFFKAERTPKDLARNRKQPDLASGDVRARPMWASWRRSLIL